MKHRFLVSLNVVVTAITIATLTPKPVAALAQDSAPLDPTPIEGYTLPRTPDGQPDLQGFWTNATYIPLERPDGVTGEFYSLEGSG